MRKCRRGAILLSLVLATVGLSENWMMPAYAQEQTTTKKSEKLSTVSENVANKTEAVTTNVTADANALQSIVRVRYMGKKLF